MCVCVCVGCVCVYGVCGLLCRVVDSVLPLLSPETLIGESLEMDEEDWRQSPYVHLLHSTAPRVFTVRTVPVQCVGGVCVCAVCGWCVCVCGW